MAIIFAGGNEKREFTFIIQEKGGRPMPAGSQTVDLVSTHQIELFIPILKEIDFGDRFMLSMLHWCGIGQRSTPLELWQVFLIQSDQEIVGVSGLYRHP